MAKSNRRGRPPKNGARYPSGKLKSPKPTIDEIVPAVWDRIRRDAIAKAADARLGSEVGRLSLHGHLTATHTSAAFRLAEIYGRYERLKGRRRSAASPSYLTGSGGDTGIAEELLTAEGLAEKEARTRAATKAFKLLQLEFRIYTPAWKPSIRAALEQLCVEDRPINPVLMGDVRGALDHLALYFGIAAAPRKKRVFAQAPAETKAEPGPNPALLDLDRRALLKALHALRPDLDDHRLAGAVEMVRALRRREGFRRGKKPDEYDHQNRAREHPSARISEVEHARGRVAISIAQRYGKISARIAD